MTILYLFATIALLISIAFIPISLLNPLPLKGLYYHYFIRKPFAWAMFGGSLLWAIWLIINHAAN